MTAPASRRRLRQGDVVDAADVRGMQSEAAGRDHKYGAVPRDAAGLTREQVEGLGLKFTKFYDSTKEAERHRVLLLKQQAGLISGLEWQPRFPIEINGIKVCVYIADARYLEDGQVVVEDVKSTATRTAVYRLKAKLLQAVHGIRIREVY